MFHLTFSGVGNEVSDRVSCSIEAMNTDSMRSDLLKVKINA